MNNQKFSEEQIKLLIKMIDINNIDQIIKDEKEIFKSKDYKENFSKIEKFIESEILQMLKKK